MLVAYFLLYSIGRLWVEALRIDEATQLGGIRINIWIFGIVAISSIGLMMIGVKRNSAFSKGKTNSNLKDDAKESWLD